MPKEKKEETAAVEPEVQVIKEDAPAEPEAVTTPPADDFDQSENADLEVKHFAGDSPDNLGKQGIEGSDANFPVEEAPVVPGKIAVAIDWDKFHGALSWFPQAVAHAGLELVHDTEARVISVLVDEIGQFKEEWNELVEKVEEPAEA